MFQISNQELFNALFKAGTEQEVDTLFSQIDLLTQVSQAINTIISGVKKGQKAA